MFERKIVVFVVIVFVAMRGERNNFFIYFFLLICMNFLSIKIHLELLQCSLYLEKHCSNFKEYLEGEQWSFLSKK